MTTPPPRVNIPAGLHAMTADELRNALAARERYLTDLHDTMDKAAAIVGSKPRDADDLLKELAAMKQRAEAAEEAMRVAKDTIDCLNGAVEMAERKAEENARDAERYRWLRSKARLEYINPKAMEDSRMEWTFPRLFGMTCVMTEIPVDEAIDAAIAAKGEA